VFYVCIRKRPGGVVPPSRKPSTPFSYHQDRQAEIDHEEKGIPLPERLGPKGRDPGDPPPKKSVIPPAGDPPKKKDEKK